MPKNQRGTSPVVVLVLLLIGLVVVLYLVQQKAIFEPKAYFNRANPNGTPSPALLTVSCVGTPNSVSVNQLVTWEATASGGTGNYQYTWSGAMNLNSDKTVNIATGRYAYPQTQTTSVSVKDMTTGAFGGASCSVRVN